MTMLATEKANSVRDVVQLLAWNERQMMKIEELEAEVEGLRTRVTGGEGKGGGTEVR
jgi:hypothetical protein